MTLRPPSIDVLDPLLGKLRQEADDGLHSTLAERARLLRSTTFGYQLSYLEDPSGRKAVLCPRRCGKTWVFAIDLLETILTVPECMVAYITMTIGQASRNIWNTLLLLNKKFSLELTSNITEKTLKAKNGSILMLGGALTKADVERYRGPSFEKCIVDEAGSFPKSHFEYLLEDVLSYALVDRMGSLIIGGTPGVTLEGPFFDATYEAWGDEEGLDAFTPRKEVRDGEEVSFCPSRPYRRRNSETYKDVIYEWSFHGWGMKDVPNTVVPNLWERALEEHKRRGESDQAPRWIREALGRWVKDDSAFVFKFDTRRNEYAPTVNGEGVALLPPEHDWQFICGADLGYDDEFALEVVAWAPTLREFFHVYEFCAPELGPLDFAREMLKADAAIKRAYGRGITVFVGDTAAGGKATIEELKDKHGIPIIPAKKSDKRDHIEILNSEMLAGRAKVMTGSKLAAQLASVLWADPVTKKKIHRSTPDDAADSYRYVVRHSLHHFGRALAPAGPAPGTPEFWEQWEQDQIDKLVAECDAPQKTLMQKLSEGLGSTSRDVADRMRLRRLDKYMS